MDTQRIIDYLKCEIKAVEEYGIFEGDAEVCKSAISAMQELERYHELEKRCREENTVGLRAMLQKFTEFREDMAELIQYRQIGTVSKCRGYQIHSQNISKLHNCNDCRRQGKCKIVPRLGEYCRINCYFWEK